MKKAGVTLVPILFFFLVSTEPSFAQTSIKNGNSTSNIRVSTNTDGGSVSTHIETTVNGQTQIIESHEEGEIEVENINGQVTVKKSTPNTTITNITKTPTPASSESASIDEDVEERKEFKKSFIEKFLKNIENFVRRFLEIF